MVSIDALRQAIREGRFGYGPHIADRMDRFGLHPSDLMVAFGEDSRVEVIEEYPGDRRGHSCLLLGYVFELPMHLVCTVRAPIFLITLYRPDPARWSADFRRRRP